MPNTADFQPSNAPVHAPATSRPSHYRDRLLRLAEVRFLTGLGKSSIYAGIQAGTFPASVNLTDYAVAWRESEIDAWIAARTSTAVELVLVAPPAPAACKPRRTAKSAMTQSAQPTKPAKSAIRAAR